MPQLGRWPKFAELPAPALMGTEAAIFEFCSSLTGHQGTLPLWLDYDQIMAERCVQANRHILRDNDWDMCVNTNWQRCALTGQLRGQGSPIVQFAIAPKDIDAQVLGGQSPSRAGGFLNFMRNLYGAVTDSLGIVDVSDVFYAEVCLTSHLCRNRDELFSLGVGVPFECDYNKSAFFELQTLMAGD